MIVNRTKKGIHIIYHAAHGLLAGKIANNIAKDFRPKHWFETLIAVTEHDDRQLNFNEKKYLSEAGIPIDFTEENPTINEIVKRMKRVISETKNKSAYTRLLITYHLEFLYGNLKSKSKKIKRFFDDETKVNQETLKIYGLSESNSRTDYQFLRFCDRLSLILCTDETPELGRSLEINKSINNTTYTISKNEDGVFKIEPWIFEMDKFQLLVEERILKQTTFSSSKAFKATLTKTLPTLQYFSLKK